LKLEPSVQPTGLLLTYKLRLKEIHTVANDKGLVRVYQDSGLGPFCNINNCPPASDTEEVLDESEFTDDFWMEFEGGGIMEFELVAFSGSTELCKDAVRACAIPCTPLAGRILFVNPATPAGPSLNDYTDDSADTIAAALSVATDNMNIAVSSANYAENMSSDSAILVEKSICLGGLGLRWETNTYSLGVGSQWMTNSPSVPVFSRLPVVLPSGSNQRCIYLRNTSGVRLGGFNVNNGSCTPPVGGAGARSDVQSLMICVVKFAGNTAKGDGGGLLCLYPTTLAIQDCQFAWNTASRGGGGMAVVGVAGSSAHILRTLVDNNSTTSDGSYATVQGGGFLIFNSLGAVTVTKCAFHNNTVEDSVEILDSNYVCGAYGGAIAIDTAVSRVMVLFTDVFGNGARSLSNRAAGGGLSVRSSEREVIVSNCQFRVNYCQGFANADACNSRAVGGGIYATLSTIDVKNTDFVSNFVHTSGKANLPEYSSGTSYIPDHMAYGGAIGGYKDAKIVISESYFKLNQSTYCGGALGFVGYHEAITGETSGKNDLTLQTIDLKESRFEENTSVWHGGAIVGASKFSGGSIADCHFVRNKVSGNRETCSTLTGRKYEASAGDYGDVDADGGAVSYQAANAGALVFADCRFLENQANGGGGAVKVGGGATAGYVRCKFEGNWCAGSGGAVRSSTGGKLSFIDCNVTGNWAGRVLSGFDSWCDEQGSGGAVSLELSQATIQGGTYEHNTAGRPSMVRDGGAFNMQSGWRGVIVTTAFGVWPSDITSLTACDVHIAGNVAHKLGGVLDAKNEAGSMAIEFVRCTVEDNAGMALVNSDGVSDDTEDPVRCNPMYAGVYASYAPVLRFPVDGFYVERCDPGGTMEPATTFRLDKSILRAKAGSTGIGLYMLSQDNTDGNAATITDTSVDGWRVGVLTRHSDIAQLSNCEFIYASQRPARVDDIMVLDHPEYGKNNQIVAVKRTLFDAHTNAVGVMIARGTPEVGPLNIAVEESYFKGRQLTAASTPALPGSAPAPMIAANGGIVVLSRALSSVDAENCYWDHSSGPLTEGPPASWNPPGGFASRMVGVFPFETAPPAVGPPAGIGAPGYP
jgi:hypothetical protein